MVKTKKRETTKVKNTATRAIKEKPIGTITHYFSNIGVAIIKFKKAVSVGDEIHIKGATTDFKQKISSMQFDHEDIKTAKPGKEVGIKVAKRVREGDMVYRT